MLELFFFLISLISTEIYLVDASDQDSTHVHRNSIGIEISPGIWRPIIVHRWSRLLQKLIRGFSAKFKKETAFVLRCVCRCARLKFPQPKKSDLSRGTGESKGPSSYKSGVVYQTLCVVWRVISSTYLKTWAGMTMSMTFPNTYGNLQLVRPIPAHQLKGVVIECWVSVAWEDLE